MVHRRRSPLVTAGVAGLLIACTAPLSAATPATASAPAQPNAPDHAPLLVTIDELTPGYVPDSGPIEISGTVTNADVVPWEDVKLYPFFDYDQVPVTTSAELAEASLAAADAYVGNRILTVEDEVGDIDPGESVPYSLTLPRSAISGRLGATGAYWFGVHALGSSESTTEDDVAVADGRARTFLPYVGRRTASSPTVETAIVVPLRRRVTHTPSGAVHRQGVWEQDLAEEGTLGSLLAFGRAATTQPVNWLVDPAVPDAVRQLVRGNHGRSLAAPAVPDTDGGGGGGDESADATEEPGDEATSDSSSDQAEFAEPAISGAADWLDDLQEELEDAEVLELPYGDLDVSGAAESDPHLYDQARDHESVLDDWDVTTTPVLGSPAGYLDTSGFLLADDASTVLVTDRMFGPEEFPNGPPAAARSGRHDIAVVSSTAPDGGPGPDPALSSVQLRQRILSEAAFRLVRPDPAPLVVVLPETVDPTDADEFWSGLDAEWLDLGTVSDATSGVAEEVDLADLTYPRSQEDYELPDFLFDEVRELDGAGASLQRLLTGNVSVAAEVRGEALAAASYNMRRDPANATAALRASREWIAQRQEAVRISAPPGVTLSSSDGSFAVTLANRLRHPVTVMIAPDAPSDIRIDAVEPIELAPKSRTTVVLEVHTDSLGVHNVRLGLTDTAGTPLGASAQVPVRSGQVGQVIWWIIGSGLTLLFVAITIRLVRRIRRARSSSDAPVEDSPETPAEVAP